MLHVNHLYHYYKHQRRIISLLRSARLFLWLILARVLGMRVVWTLHNLSPHESRSRWIDRLCRLFLCRMAGSVIVHCEIARAQLAGEFGRAHNVHVVPHGNYIDAYPPAIPKKQARLALGLPLESHVSLYFGNVRAYKGIEDLITAFLAVDLVDGHLVIAGKIWPDYDGSDVARAKKDRSESNVTRLLKPSSETFSGEEIRDIMCAADVVVLPFKQVLSSGSAMLALSYAKPVICPRLGCLPELLEDCDGALLYDPDSRDGLAGALRAGRDLDLEMASRAALERALQMSWSLIVEKTERAYEMA